MSARWARECTAGLAESSSQVFFCFLLLEHRIRRPTTSFVALHVLASPPTPRFFPPIELVENASHQRRRCLTFFAAGGCLKGRGGVAKARRTSLRFCAARWIERAARRAALRLCFVGSS